MGSSSADIEALLVDVNDLANPTPGMLPAIFRDIVGGLEAEGYTYAVVGRIALTLHEQARYVGAIEIVADLSADGRRCAAGLVKATRARFAAHMNPKLCPRPIELTLRPCICATEAGLLAEAITRPWFDVPARLASAEHLLWLWCHSDGVDNPADACALIAGGDRRSLSRAGPSAGDGRRRRGGAEAAAAGDWRCSPVNDVLV